MTVRVQFLKPGEGMPKGEGPWLIIERDAGGRYYGSGEGRKETGEIAFYVSAPENDVSLSAALAAAQCWAEHRCVPIVYVQEAVDVE